MILDQDLMLSEAQAITVDAASSGYIALAGALGKDLYAVFRVETTFDSDGDAATLNIKLQTATDTAFTSPVTLVESGNLAQAALVADAIVWKCAVPKAGHLGYFRAYYDNGTEAFTAGKMDAFLVPDIEVLPA